MKATATIDGSNLSEISKALFSKDIFEYHLRTLLGRSNTQEEVLRGVTAKIVNGDLRIYSAYEISEDLNPLTEDKPLMNILCQLRFISTNPITIYHRLLENEFRMELLKTNNETNRKGIRLSSLVVPGVDRYAVGKMKFEPIVSQQPLAPVKPEPTQETQEQKGQDVFESKGISEGHMMFELLPEEMYVPGQVRWKEGPLADAYPSYLENTLDDYEGGVVVSVFPGMPFYAYSHINVYPAIQDLNRMIEAGNQVVFLESGTDEERLSYESIFSDWGIPIIDYVDETRLVKNGVRIHGAYPISPFFVIQRPQTVLHNSAWAGISNDRRRGLAGIPWALRKDEKPGLFDLQPDDGFLGYWLRDVYVKRSRGNGAVQVYFPLPSITPIYKIKKNVVAPLEGVLDRQLYFTHYPDQCVAGVFLKNMGEWIAFRALLRKHI